VLLFTFRTLDGTWNVFTGNEIGVLLGHYQIQKFLAGGRGDQKAAVLTTVVSSRMLKGIAEKEGIHYAATLTGD
jgi:phosphoglucomutase